MSLSQSSIAFVTNPQKSSIPNYRWAPLLHWTIRTLFQLLGGITASGHENIPVSGPVLLCPNHISNADAFAIYATSPRRDIYFVANVELFSMRIFGRGMRAFGTVPIQRHSADRGALRRALKILEDGNVLVLFPEGEISESECLGPLKPGAALIALRSRAAVVPVALARTNCFVPYGNFRLLRSKLPARVLFGKPLSVDDSVSKNERKSIAASSEQLEDALRELVIRNGGRP